MRTDAITITYGGKVAVNGVDLPVHQGEVLALIGPSGLREDDAAAVAEPARRADARAPRAAGASCSTATTSTRSR